MSEPTLAMDAATGNGVEPNNAPVGDNTPAGGENNGGGHPAWQPVYDDVFSILPEQLHPLVKERLDKHFKEWDSGVQNKIQQVHSEYESYKPFRENNIDPQHLTAAWQFFNAFNANPQEMWTQLGQHFGFPVGSEQGQNNNQPDEVDLSAGNDPEMDITQHPAFQQLSQQQQMLIQHITQQQQMEEQRESAAWLDQKLAPIEAKYGQDEDAMKYILQVARVHGETTGDFEAGIDKGVAAYEALLNKVRSTPRPGDLAPQVMPTGGSVPSAGIPTADLDSAQRRAQMVQLLNLANQQG